MKNRKLNAGAAAFINGEAYLAGAAVNLAVFRNKGLSGILLAEGTAEMLIGMAARRKEKTKTDI